MTAPQPLHYPPAGIGKSAKAPGPVELATARLRSAGLRITQPRIAILTVLSRREQPISIEQIHGLVGPANCDLVTVYRCMTAFEEIGLVRRAFFHDGTALYEMALGRPARYHVVCKRTNQVMELDVATAEAVRRAVEAVEADLTARGFTHLGHIVEFFGISPTKPAGECT